MYELGQLLLLLIQFYSYCVIASVILSWLVAFNVVNTHNRVVSAIGEFLYRITEPALAPIRRYVPSFGGIDISPFILLLLLWFLSMVIARRWPW